MEVDYLSPTSSSPHRLMNSLYIVKKIVEREGCIEALRQILSDILISENQNVQPTLVLNGLIEQLREISVIIVESIEKWKKTINDQVPFQWKAQNYLLKMTSDLDLLLPTLKIPHIATERNPFISPLDLTHPVFSEVFPDSALEACRFVGNVDMRRIFYASRILKKEITALKNEVSDSNTLLTTAQIMSPQLRVISNNESDDQSATPSFSQNSIVPDKISTSVSTVLNTALNDIVGTDSLKNDLKLAKSMIIQEERTLGALKEKIAKVQAEIGSSDGPDKRRRIQKKIAALINELKFCTGDLYQRKNELKRKEAIFRLVHVQIPRKRPTGPIQTEKALTSPHNSFQIKNVLDEAIELDELRRQKIIEFLATSGKRA